VQCLLIEPVEQVSERLRRAVGGTSETSGPAVVRIPDPERAQPRASRRARRKWSRTRPTRDAALELIGRALGHEAALIQHRYPAGELIRLVEVLRREQDGDSRCRKARG